jgi:hypothetical protein
MEQIGGHPAATRAERTAALGASSTRDVWQEKGRLATKKPAP